ncbi:MAG: hypothetical protein GDA48_26475 [Hormoscilla sp. GM102CHS1]|nr:hypothetical protein [Hormoscilla sp. GM102CHS1]
MDPRPDFSDRPRAERKELQKLIHQILSATNSGLEMCDTILEKRLLQFCAEKFPHFAVIPPGLKPWRQ